MKAFNKKIHKESSSLPLIRVVYFLSFKKVSAFELSKQIKG